MRFEMAELLFSRSGLSASLCLCGEKFFVFRVRSAA
jgi:hypothetical protein